MTSERLSRALFLAVRLTVLHTHTRRKISQYYCVVYKIMSSLKKKTCKSCKGPTVKEKVLVFFKEITFRLRHALGMRHCAPYAMHHGAMEAL